MSCTSPTHHQQGLKGILKSPPSCWEEPFTVYVKPLAAFILPPPPPEVPFDRNSPKYRWFAVGSPLLTLKALQMTWYQCMLTRAQTMQQQACSELGGSIL